MLQAFYFFLSFQLTCKTLDTDRGENYSTWKLFQRELCIVISSFPNVNNAMKKKKEKEQRQNGQRGRTGSRKIKPRRSW